MHCASVEADSDFVELANSTFQLNCTLSQNGTVTWLHNDKKIEPESADNGYELEQGSLRVVVGEFLCFIFVCGKTVAFLFRFSVAS